MAQVRKKTNNNLSPKLMGKKPKNKKRLTSHLSLSPYTKKGQWVLGN